MLLIQKIFPPKILIKLAEAKLVALDWNVSIMVNKLHESIRLRERAYTVTEHKLSKRDRTPTEIRQKPITQVIKPVVASSSEMREKKPIN